jgi:hypothetical protein
MTDQELKDLVASLAVDTKELKKIFAKSDAKWERISARLGSMADNQGYTTEDYFYNSLLDTMKMGDIKYDDIAKNIHVKSKRMEDEFDIVMYNGNSIALIECKYKAHKSDVENLIHKKVTNFRLSHPDFADYKIYLGIASFGFYSELEQYAKENGVAILKQKGDITTIEDNNLKVY